MVPVRADQGKPGLEAWPVDGPLTDDELRATPVPVSGTLTSDTNTGRTELRFYTTNLLTPGSTGVDTMVTLTKSSGTAATTTGTSFVVTSGKKFRITHISLSLRNASAATSPTAIFNFRVNTGGAAIASSTPIILAARCATPAVALEFDRNSIPLGEGMEILGDGTLQFGVSCLASFANQPTIDVLIIGYEY